MRLFTLALILAFAACALAGGGEVKHPKPKNTYHINATWSCWHQHHGLSATYTLIGTDWNLTEHDLKQIAADTAIYRAWHFDSWIDSGHERFYVTWKTLIGRQKGLEGHVNWALGIQPGKHMYNDKSLPIMQSFKCPRRKKH